MVGSQCRIPDRLESPFGGWGESGIGLRHGAQGIRSQPRHIVAPVLHPYIL
jgi:acyl-CoA reductase-like NAD-dependent aldehyde dehydrogenase